MGYCDGSGLSRSPLQQERLFLQHAGYTRFAYNWAVGEFSAGLDVGEWLIERALRPRWNRSRA